MLEDITHISARPKPHALLRLSFILLRDEDYEEGERHTLLLLLADAKFTHTRTVMMMVRIRAHTAILQQAHESAHSFIFL